MGAHQSTYGAHMPPPFSYYELRYDSFTEANEAKDALSTKRKGVLQQRFIRMANGSLDTDPVCNVCVFGLMGHGKSRFINMVMTATVPGNDELSNEVPSGPGSTTRSYGKYALPVSNKLGKNPFAVVDTIGVKFADEADPSPYEMIKEFGLVSRQLRALDFRGRVGSFKSGFRPPDMPEEYVAKGEDIVDIFGVQTATEDQPATATVTLRGGVDIKNVPLTKLYDPDGVNWTFSDDKGFKDKRGVMKRVQHALYGLPFLQPRCHSVILVTNPNQPTPDRVYDKWREVFKANGFGDAVLVSTHSDVTELFGDKAQDVYREGSARLDNIRFADDIEHASWPHRVENYAERSAGSNRRITDEQRRQVSEASALDAMVRSCEFAQQVVRATKPQDMVAVGVMAGFLGLGFMGLRMRGVRRTLAKRAARTEAASPPPPHD